MKSVCKGNNAIPLWTNLGKSRRRLYGRPQKHCPSTSEAKITSVMTHWDSDITDWKSKAKLSAWNALKKEVKYIKFLDLSVPLLGVCKHYERPGDSCRFYFWQALSVRELDSQWIFWLLFWVLLYGLCFTMTQLSPRFTGVKASYPAHAFSFAMCFWLKAHCIKSKETKHT